MSGLFNKSDMSICISSYIHKGIKFVFPTILKKMWLKNCLYWLDTTIIKFSTKLFFLSLQIIILKFFIVDGEPKLGFYQSSSAVFSQLVSSKYASIFTESLQKRMLLASPEPRPKKPLLFINEYVYTSILVTPCWWMNFYFVIWRSPLGVREYNS